MKINLKNRTNYIALMGLLCALAMALTALEGIFTPVLPVGVRIGLANVVVLFALLALDTRSAFGIVLIKAGFVLLTRGVTSFGMSLCGGMLALFIMLFLYKKTGASVFRMSLAGAVTHNFGQLILAVIITNSINTLFYAPVLLIAGLGAGVCTAAILRVILPAILKRWQ